MRASKSMLSRRCNMDDRNALGPWLRRFLLEHLVSERNLSLNTQRSYRDTLVLLVAFLRARSGRPRSISPHWTLQRNRSCHSCCIWNILHLRDLYQKSAP